MWGKVAKALLCMADLTQHLSFCAAYGVLPPLGDSQHVCPFLKALRNPAREEAESLGLAQFLPN